MYTTDDPRSALADAAAGSKPDATTEVRDFQYTEFGNQPPEQTSAAGSPTWVVRAQNFALALTHLVAGDTLERQQEQEYVALLPDAHTDIVARAGERTVTVTEVAMLVLPPGHSTITARSACTVVRLFDAAATDVLDRASNRDAYVHPDPRTTPLAPWPAPAEDRLRVYLPERFESQPGRFGRIFRTRCFMVNFLDDQMGPRDPEKLSPHHHDDFEQCSLAVEGAYVHHIRSPWTSRRSQWRDDVHQLVGSPSVAIIPPPTVHTSEATGSGLNRLIDIFSPPRTDFSAAPGWVLNEDDYPQPQ